MSGSEHAETIRRRCPLTVRGFALHAECTGPGGHVGESAPGPTGSTWAQERSEPRHAQAERPLIERSGARVCSSGLWAPTQEWLSAGIPGAYAVRSGGTLERRTYCRCKAGTERKCDDEKQVQRGDTPSSGLAPPAPEVTGHSGVTESSAEQTRFCVKCREGDKGGKPLKTAQHHRVVLQTSVCELSASNSTDQAGEQATSLPATGPSGPGPNGPQARACQKVSRPSGPDRAAWQTSVCADIIRPSGHVQEFVGILTWGIAVVGGMVVGGQAVRSCVTSGAGSVLRVCGAVSSSGTGGACFRSWSLKRC